MSPQAFAARSLKEFLAKEKKVRQAFLFGSVAKGEEKLSSDVDLALLAEKSFDANALVYYCFERFGAKIVPLVFSNEKELKEFLSGKKTERLK